MAGKKAEKLGEDWAANVPEEGWLEESTGFDPYWTPELGATFRGTCIEVDNRDKNFIRFKITNTSEEPVICKRGPAEDAEEIAVNKDENFTCSAYASLPLDRFFGIDVRVVVTENRKLPPNEFSDGRPRDLWVFKVLVSPADKKLLADQRKAQAVHMREAAQKARMDRMLVTDSPNGNRSLPKASKTERFSEDNT